MPTWLIVVIIIGVLVGLGTLLGRAERRRTARRKEAFDGDEDAFAVCDVLIHAVVAAGRGGADKVHAISLAAGRVLGRPTVNQSRIAQAFGLAIKDPAMMDVADQVAAIPPKMRDAVLREAIDLYRSRLGINPDDSESAVYLRRLMIASGRTPDQVRAALSHATKQV